MDLRKWVRPVLALAALVAVGAACDQAEVVGPVYAPSPGGTVPSPAISAPRVSQLGPGDYRVGTEPGQVPPGTEWETVGPSSWRAGGICFWKVVGADGEARAHRLVSGPTFFVVEPGDKQVALQGCVFTKSE